MPYPSLAHEAHALGGTDLVGWLLAGLVVLAPSISYVNAARARRSRGRAWPGWRGVSWVVGLVLVAAAVSPPLRSLGQHDAHGHMIQHLTLGMFAPLALVLAAPVTLLLGSLSLVHRKTAAAVLHNRFLHGLTHPAAAAVLHIGGLYLLYLTPLYASATDNALVHHAVTVHFLVAGYLFAWSIVGPDTAHRRPGTAVRVVVLVIAGGAHSFLAKLLYARASELPPGTTHAVSSMQTAAQLMYYGGDLAELALAIALFAGWYRLRRPSRRARAPEPRTR